MRWGFADPPYPGLAEYYADHPDYGGEVDHEELVASLNAEFDGWALCTSSDAARWVWNLCPPGTKLAPWIRGARNGKTLHPAKTWEAVLYFGDRPLLSTHRFDALAFTSRPRTSDPRRVIGAKPAKFAYWIFDLLGAQPGDTFVDLFPGSGGVARAWQIFASQQAQSDASGLPGEDASA